MITVGSPGLSTMLSRLEILNIITSAKSFLPYLPVLRVGIRYRWVRALFCPLQVVNCLPSLFFYHHLPMSHIPYPAPSERAVLFNFFGWSFALQLYPLEAWALCGWVLRMQTAAWCLLDTNMCDVQLGTVLLSVHMVMDSHSSFLGLVLFGTKMVTPVISLLTNSANILCLVRRPIIPNSLWTQIVCGSWMTLDVILP